MGLASVVATRFAKGFPDQATLHRYLHEHPKADPKKHSVRKPTETSEAPAGHKFDDAADVARDLAAQWKGKGQEQDAVSKLIAKLQSDAPVTKPELEAALAAAKGKAESVEHIVEDLIEEVTDRSATPVETPKTSESPKQDPEAEAKPPTEVAKPHDSGAGPHKIPHANEALEARFAALTTVTLEQREQFGGIAGAMIANAVGKKEAEAASKWCKSWETTSGEKRVERAMQALSEPGSWAQAQYYATQKHLKGRLAKLQEEGIADKDGYITLFRGVTGDQAASLRSHVKSGQECLLKNRQLSSWTADAKVGRKFGRGRYRNLSGKGVLMKQKIHYSRIFAAHTAQRGWAAESEYIVMSPEQQIVATLEEKLT